MWNITVVVQNNSTVYTFFFHSWWMWLHNHLVICKEDLQYTFQPHFQFHDTQFHDPDLLRMVQCTCFPWYNDLLFWLELYLLFMVWWFNYTFPEPLLCKLFWLHLQKNYLSFSIFPSHTCAFVRAASSRNYFALLLLLVTIVCVFVFKSHYFSFFLDIIFILCSRIQEMFGLLLSLTTVLLSLLFWKSIVNSSLFFFSLKEHYRFKDIIRLPSPSVCTKVWHDTIKRTLE